MVMPYLQWVDKLESLRLDVVGIVAVLGEGCTARTIDASSLSWHHVLPRLLPAPQALLKYDRPLRLDTEEGTVIGVYSGYPGSRLNHFCRLLHHQPLQRNQVELVEVTRKPSTWRAPAFRAREFGYLAMLSILGTLLAVALLVASIVLRDGFALVATLLLASTSSIAGLASRWKLELKVMTPQGNLGSVIPHSDLVIHYPIGAFRIVRCDEEVAQLYFTPEICKRDVSDNEYRFLALLASVFLMIGLLCMGNCRVALQLAFAAAYILLNVCYWAVSAVNPMKHHWKHDFIVKKHEYVIPLSGTKIHGTGSGAEQHVSPIPRVRRSQGPDLEAYEQKNPAANHASDKRKRTLRNLLGLKPPATEDEDFRELTQALWIAIALSGTAQWLKSTRIAPDTEVWRKWIASAEKHILSRRNRRGQLVPSLLKYDEKLVIPSWDYNGELLRLLRREDETKRHRPPEPRTLPEVLSTGPAGLPLNVNARIRLRAWAKRTRQRISEANSVAHAATSSSPNC